ncbi:MAG TPA: hypothetical protein VHE81_15830, partial [Lacipirellulaceae bacterium]|nr:hypothetical protein [Lacipirellulaceae bacterium]
MSIPASCQREKLTESTYFAWRQTIRERDVEAKSPTGRGRRPKRPVFLPVVVDQDRGRNGTIAVELAGERVLRLSESIPTARLAELVSSSATSRHNGRRSCG